MFSFTRKLKRKAKHISEKFKPDVVIASSTYPMDIYPCRKIAKLSNAKLIYEVHDLWPLSPMELGGMSKYHPFIMLVQKAEDYAYKHVDHVVSMLPATKDYMVSRGLVEDKWSHVPNGIIVDKWNDEGKLPEEHLAELKRIKEGGKTIVGYIGGHAISNSLQYLVEAANQYKGNEVHFVLVGKGVEKSKLIEMAKGNDNISFLDPVPKTEVSELLKNMDILYIGWNKSPLYKYGISPNKIFDYMMASKPIIHSVEAANDIVKDSNCGISIEPEDPKEILKAIQTLINKTDPVLEQMGARGREYVLKHHDYKKLAADFLSVLATS